MVFNYRKFNLMHFLLPTDTALPSVEAAQIEVKENKYKNYNVH